MKKILPLLLMGTFLPGMALAAHFPVDIVNDQYGKFETFDIGRVKGANRQYVLAEPGQSYKIRITNPYGNRVGVVLAVDGRNVIDGSKSDLKSKERKYILNPYQTITVTGWRTGQNQVNEFYFSDETQSYSNKTFADKSAMGVIGLSFFAEVPQIPEELEISKNENSYYPELPAAERADSRGSDSGASPAPSIMGGIVSTDAVKRMEKQEKRQAGTGFGRSHYSPSMRVEFTAETTPLEKKLIKYEWKESLCEKGIIKCGYPENGEYNRLWGNGYAPHPPSVTPTIIK